MKKFLTYSIVAATIAWSMGISAVLPAVASTGIVDGNIIKTATSNAVYYVTGGKKMLMVNRATYSSWSSAIGDTEDKFAGLKVVSQADFDAVPYGANITVRPGTNLIKFNDSADVFAVGTDAKLYRLADAAAKDALYPGVTPVTIFNSFRANYYNNGNPVATLTATSNYPDGTFIKSADAADVYVLEGGLRRPIDENGWAANGLKMSFVRTTDVTAYTTGAAVTGKEAWSSMPTTGTAPTGSVSVSLAATSPAATTVISGQAIADLAHFTFSGTGVVTGLKITKIGIASDATLDKVYLYDGNTKISDAGSVSSGVISFNNPAGLFTVSGSKVISVRSDIAGDAGQLVGVSINSAADVSGVNVGGSFPIRGNLMSVAKVDDLAKATTTVNSSTTVPIDAGTANVTLWDASINVQERAVKMKYLALNMIGSAPADAIVNAKLYVNGVNVASGVVNANKILAFDLGTGVDLNTAGAQSVEVRGEIVKGTDRSFYLSLREVSDIVLVDSSYNVNIASAILFGQGDTFSINKGQVSITTDPDFNTTQIIRTASNQTLGKWIIKAYGEDAKFMSVKASTTWAGSVASGDRINNLSIWVNGSQVGSSQSYDLNVGGERTFGSGNLFTVSAGQEAVVEIRGDLSLNTSGVTGLGSSLKIEVGQIQGVTSFHTAYTAANGTANSSNPATLTVVDGAVTLERNSSYGAQTLSPNTQAAKIGSFVISAGDTDSVRVTNVRIGLGGSLSFATNTSQLYISENLGNKVNPQTTNNFAVDFTLQPNQTKTIDVFVNIGNVVAELGNNIVATMDITARNSSNAIAYSDGAVTGQTITVNTGSLSTIAKNNDSMSSQYVIGGAQNINSMIVNFRADNSSVIIEEMGFVFGGNASTGAVPVTAVTVGGVTRNVASSTAVTNVTGLNITVPAGPAGLNVPVAVNYNTVGYLGNLDANKVVSSSLVSIKYRVGSQSVTTTTLSNLPINSDGFLMVTTKPVVAFPSAGQPTTWSNGTTRVARITVTADPSGPILLKALPVKFSTTSASFTYTADSLIVRTANGDLLTTTNLAVPGAGTTTIAFAGDGLNISAGSTATLDIFVQGAAVVGTPSAGTASIGLELGAKELFSWRDVNGEATISGAYYSSWPIEGITLSR